MNFTYKGTNTQKWLDHVIINDNNIKNIDIKIMNDHNNRSDHLAINILTEHNQRINGPLKVNNDYIPKFVLNSKAFQIKFNNALRLELAESLHLAKKLNLMEPKNKQNNIKIILDNISNIILKTVKTSAEQYRSSKTFQHIKSKVWWNDECQQLHDDKHELFKIRPRDSITKRKIKIIDNKIAAIKNNWEKRGLKSNAHKLNKLFKSNKNNFWKTMKNLQTNRTDVNLPIEKIKEDFELLFNSKLITNSTQELKAIKEITERNYIFG